MPSVLAGNADQRDVEVITLVSVAHGVSHFFHLMLPPLFPWLMGDFGLSFTQVGFLMTVFFVISAVGQALAGFVVDRIGARPVLFSGIALLALSGLVLAFAHGYSMLVAVAAIAGMGNSVFHPADFTLLNRRVTPPRLGHAFSMHGLIGNVGWALAPVLMAGTAGLFGWHAAGLVAAAMAGGVLALLVTRRHALDDVAREIVHPHEPAARQAVNGRFGFLASGAVWMCFSFFFVSTMAFGILQGYSPSALQHVYGIGLALATSGLTSYLIGSAAGMITGGFLAARSEDNDQLIARALALSAAMAALIAAGWLPGWSVVATMAVMGFGVGIAGPNRDLLVRKAATAQFGRASFGRVYGFVYSGLDLGIAIAPVAFGPLMDAAQFQLVLAGVAVLQALAILTALRVGTGVRATVSHG